MAKDCNYFPCNSTDEFLLALTVKVKTYVRITAVLAPSHKFRTFYVNQLLVLQQTGAIVYWF